eukprot:8047545-Lingulodinium_polyedra.AAC.1
MTFGVGRARDLKDRLVVLCRQGLHGVFVLQEGGELKGSVLDSVLIVHCSSRCRLECISEEGAWLREETFEQDGQLVHRKEGDKVHPVLM